MIVEYIVANPPLSNKYIALKEALVNHFEIPQERRFKKLLSGIELRERRPTELLAEINRLGGNNLDPSFVRSMWLDRLPLQIQLALTATGEQDNAKLAQTANRLMAIQRDSENHCVMPIARETVASGGIQKQLDKLAKQVEKLSQRLNRSTVGEDSQKRFNNSTNVSRSTTDNTSTSTWKRQSPPVDTADTGGKSIPRRLFVYDRTTGTKFLVDTGADISVTPPSRQDQTTPTQFHLQAANGSKIETYGEKVIVLNIGLQRPIRWIFRIAKVPYPIIGADLIHALGLIADLKRGHLIDPNSDSHSIGSYATAVCFGKQLK
ncbi:uncharacterized protein LOC128861212 [Anastrepha ludens]|uniref:uncharacterized protein LOC128861212 n=1 Tax=Anastrepha ludens TaxID=28586 RepID=UPI0023B07660|nr:uncharacterized protein LOC128861212 [Anastrepha ludens]